MKRSRPVLKVYMTKAEKARVAACAASCRMTSSGYAKMVLLGHQPVSCTDLKQMEGVLKVAADLGRLGGLLKMTLTNDERLQDMGREMGLVTIDGILVDIRVTQANLRKLVELVLKRANHA